MTQQMTTKVAPAYDERISIFAFEDATDDWCDITELEAERRGPALGIDWKVTQRNTKGYWIANS